MGGETADKGARIGAAIKHGQIVREGAILQAGLITGDEDPVVTGTKQGATLGGERLASLRIRNLRDIWIEVRSAVMRARLQLSQKGCVMELIRPISPWPSSKAYRRAVSPA